MIVARDDGHLDRTRRLGLDRFTRLVRAEVTRRGKTKPCLRIVRKVFTALTKTAGVLEHRQAALERIGWTLTDWDRARTDQDLVEARMVAVLGQLGLTEELRAKDRGEGVARPVPTRLELSCDIGEGRHVRPHNARDVTRGKRRTGHSPGSPQLRLRRLHSAR